MAIRRPYALAALAILAVEILIALFVRDRFVRPYLGDTLAVALVHAALRASTPLRPAPAAVEFGQYFHLVEALGLGASPLARIVLGTGFELLDFVAYTAGALAVLVAERLYGARRERRGVKTS